MQRFWHLEAEPQCSICNVHWFRGKNWHFDFPAQYTFYTSSPLSPLWQAGVGRRQSDPLLNRCLDILRFDTILPSFFSPCYTETGKGVCFSVSGGHFCRTGCKLSFTTELNEPGGRKLAQNVKCHFIQEFTWTSNWSFSLANNSNLQKLYASA